MIEPTESITSNSSPVVAKCHYIAEMCLLHHRLAMGDMFGDATWCVPLLHVSVAAVM
jgi:hypothetical protein